MNRVLSQLLSGGYFSEGGAYRSKVRAKCAAEKKRSSGYCARLFVASARRRDPEYFVMVKPKGSEKRKARVGVVKMAGRRHTIR